MKLNLATEYINLGIDRRKALSLAHLEVQVDELNPIHDPTKTECWNGCQHMFVTIGTTMDMWVFDKKQKKWVYRV